MKISALFLLLILVPSLLCEQSILEMIETVPEAKEVMNAIYLQVHMKGANLQTGDIYNVLKYARTRADNQEASMKQRMDSTKKECESDLQNFGAKVHENQKWEFTVTRHVNNNDRAHSRVQAFIDRTGVEKNDYEALSNLVQAGFKDWQAFQKTAIADMQKALTLIKQARTALRKAGEKKPALFEIKEDHEYFTNLNEIRVGFQQNNANLEGFRPVISKLLELMAKPAAVDKPAVRRKLSLLFKKIARQIRERKNEVEASNERAEAMFNAILESYKDNLLRISKLLERLRKEMSEINDRTKALNDTRARAVSIKERSKTVFTLRKAACIAHGERFARLAVSLQKIRNIVAQIAEILSERFGALKGYFLERNSKLLG
jgi:hypothetical protein